MNKPWLVWDSGNGSMEEFNTEEEAKEFATETIDVYRDEARDNGEWSDEVEFIGVYKLAYDIQKIDQEGECVDYGILPVSPQLT